MKQNKFGELIFDQADVCELLMQAQPLEQLQGIIVDQTVDLSQWPDTIDLITNFEQEKHHDCTVAEFHAQQQSNWHMPDSYKTMDIAKYVLDLCNNESELQRCGAELLLFQEKNLFDLLRYLKYLVDVMQSNNIIWGVGRGSSVSSYVLYKLKLHRIDSLYYNLDISEFLR